MDTKDVAADLGTTPRVFRAFLRSPMSTFVAVGSGARYEFTEQDLPVLRKRFAEWQGAGKPKPSNGATQIPRTRNTRSQATKAKDEEMWAEEGPVRLEDIRNPQVRARVKAAAQAAEDRLTLMLLAKGMHITQLRDKQLKAS